MPPEGKYTKVHVVNIQSGPGALTDGTATLSNGVLSCGTFEKNDHPAIGEHYNINGVSDVDHVTHYFQNYKCVASGPTGDFKETKGQATQKERT